MPIKITIQEEGKEEKKDKEKKKSTPKSKHPGRPRKTVSRKTKNASPKRKVSTQVKKKSERTKIVVSQQEEANKESLAEEKKKIIKIIEDNEKQARDDLSLDESQKEKRKTDTTPESEPLVIKEDEKGNDLLKEEDEKEISSSGGHSIKLYRRIAFSFIFLTVILLGVIFYFSFVRVSIVLIPNQERITNNLIIDIYDKNKELKKTDASIYGVVRKISLSQSDVYPATGEEVIGEEVVGKAIIVNNYYKNQPLVATTRLLTPDNKLYRIKETVNVPAGGEIEVDIYADEPSRDMVVGPTKFIIPGLWAGLQDKIYARSKEATQYKQKVKKHIQDVDIENARRDLKQRLLTKAKDEINDIYQEYDQLIYDIDEDSVSVSVDAQVGEEVEEFSASIKADIILVGFDSEEAAKLARQRFISSLPSDKELIEFNDKDIIYSLNSYDYEEGVASVNAVFEGRVSLKNNANIIDVNKILGLNKDQLEAYLSSLPDIAGFEVKFSPSFIKTVPDLVDRIDIEIRK